MNDTGFFKRFINTRKISYYFAFTAGLISFIIGVVATVSLGDAGATALPMILTLIGFVLFLILSLVGQERTGSALVAFASFGALVALVCEVFEYFLDAVQNQSMTGFDVGAIDGFPVLIVCVAVLLVCAIAANITAWLKLKKEDRRN